MARDLKTEAGLLLYQLRTDRDLTAVTLAWNSKVHPSMISVLERGGGCLRRTALRVARALKDAGAPYADCQRWLTMMGFAMEGAPEADADTLRAQANWLRANGNTRHAITRAVEGILESRTPANVRVLREAGAV